MSGTATGSPADGGQRRSPIARIVNVTTPSQPFGPLEGDRDPALSRIPQACGEGQLTYPDFEGRLDAVRGTPSLAVPQVLARGFE